MPTAAGMAYEEHGGGIKSPPLVFLHGAGGSRLHWPPTMRRLAGSRCLAVDLPGHGESPGEGEDSVAAYAARLDDWRRALGVERAWLVGHSMGSAIALTAGLDSPAWVSGLALLGAAARMPVNPSLLEGTGDPARFGDTVELILRWSFAAGATPRLVELARRRMHEAGPTVLHRDFLACSVFDVQSRLAGLRLPVLIVSGSEDRMVSPARSEELARAIEGATMVVVNASGHMVMLERPGDVESALRRFLSLKVA
ncbi:MAG TPA: alpha/beta fold hydrolase [Anaerolineales bacterium]|nr:alpha/beta fold hydrolase [Anaerolineales bacterium]